MDSEERGLQGFQALSQYFLGYARLHQGDYSQATHCAKSALPLAEQTCEYEIFSQAQMLVAAVDLAKGRYDKAREGFPEAIEIGQQKRYVKVLFGEGCGKFGLVCSQLELGDTKTARQISPGLSPRRGHCSPLRQAAVCILRARFTEHESW